MRSKQIDVLTATAKAELGYIEKKNGEQLDEKTANVGSGNYTKYARDLIANKEISPNPYSQGAAWCDMFVDWVFIKSFGTVEAERLLIGWSAYTPTSAGYFKAAKRWHATPKPGDVIFFENSERICHTGIVYAVDDTHVHCYEGNTSSGVLVVPNGGAVCAKQYVLSNKAIAGYGRPDYKEEKEMSYEDFKAYMERYLAEQAEKGPNPVMALEEFEQAKEAGITDGTTPQMYATRQQAAVMVHRAFMQKAMR